MKKTNKGTSKIKEIKEIKPKIKEIKESESNEDKSLSEDVEEAERGMRESFVSNSGFEAPSLALAADVKIEGGEDVQLRKDNKERQELERKNTEREISYRATQQSENSGYYTTNAAQASGGGMATRDIFRERRAVGGGARFMEQSNAQLQEERIGRGGGLERKYEAEAGQQKKKKIYPWEA